ncbi:MAG: hypothetical protein JNL05_13925 [Flavobacteriales bacterium]|nr:hypothetical protein [Flavobacteriales bacterium]
MRHLLLVCLGPLLITQALAQNIGINVNGAAPDASALLDIDGSALPANAQRGLLIPRVALTASNVAAPVVAPTPSLLVYNNATAGAPPNNVTPGYHYWNGSAWVRFGLSGEAWSLTGNAGTNPAVNFIGTTDAQPWIIKTGGSAAANERMRFLAGGQAIVNNTTLGVNTNDVFSVYATGTTNGTTANTAALGTRAISGYTSTGFGVLGSTTGNTGTTMGVVGFATSTTGSTNAVRGEAASVNGTAIIGIGNTSSGAVPTGTGARGVLGQVNGTLSGTAQAIGVQGLVNATMTTGDARGVNGSSPSDNGLGVIGFQTSTATTGFPAGTWGQAASPAGVGAVGVNTSSAATVFNPTGVYGQANNASGFGVDGFNANATGTGVLGEGNGIGGTYLLAGGGGAFTGTSNGALALATTAASGTGLIAAGNNAGFNTLVQGSGVAATGVNFGVYGVATSNANGSAGAPARAGGYFVSGSGGAQVFTYVACYEGGGTPRKVMGNGTVNTVVRDEAGRHVLLSAPEAPENLFQDLGSGQLVNGRAHVTLDPTFTRNILVNEQHPLRVFVQLRGDCKGVYVTNETSEGFDVVELQGGTSNVPFHWTVSANRANQVLPDGTVWPFAEERFPVTQGPQATESPAAMQRQARSAEVRPMAPTGAQADGRP